MHDGETCQVQTWGTETTEIAETFEQEYIAVGKLGASTTGVSQPLDTGKMFCAVKKHVRGQYLGCPEQCGHNTLKEIVESIIQKRKRGGRKPKTSW